jgi:hypothetical protein
VCRVSYLSSSSLLTVFLDSNKSGGTIEKKSGLEAILEDKDFFIFKKVSKIKV